MQIDNPAILFCDDVREEGGGKVSLMGLFGPDVAIPEIPAVLPRLCVIFMADVIGDEPFTLSGTMTSPEGVLLPAPMKTVFTRPEPQGSGPGREVWNLRVVAVLNNVKVERPSSINVTFALNEVEVQRSLRIVIGDADYRPPQKIAAGPLAATGTTQKEVE